ncbi:hypothetical protein [Wenxinia marina]|uniref:Uncharacterized protein n=1 Tax=Wenxinia marina DSM 24838 TaxID=1123501 RepID=A0A0D0Q2H9_9RHOB|nr:hypothetical protein [Wenxinia marina]KIQ68724.1 hypothetical protein Wenmar_02449 [Wenxinia marina DSM 24838]GGL65673.1 hypothetical protein GCM10011392_20460 [Wenxinia marina]
MGAPSAAEAIANNVALCRAVLSANGRRVTPFGDGYVTWDAPLPLYPSAVLTAPERPDGLVRLPEGAGVKDATGRHDLSPLGFRRLIEARWIGFPAPRPEPAHAPERIGRDGLRDWAAAWDGGAEVWRSGLLALPEVRIVGWRLARRLIAGAVLNEGPAGTVGLSNLFGPPEDLPSRIAGIAATWLDRAVVAWEADPAPFLALGFADLGPLAVWLRT